MKTDGKEEIILVTIGLILTGAVFLIVGLFQGIRIHNIVPRSLKIKWVIINSLIGVFFLSYLLSIIYIYWNNEAHLLTGLVFLGGGVFVALIMTLNVKTMHAMVSKEQLEKMNKNLENQIDFFHNTIESLTHPFYVIDTKSYRIKIANSAARLGSLGNESTCYELTHKNNKPCGSKEHICPLEQVLKTKKPVVVEHIHFDKEGNKRDVEVHAYPIFDQQGNIPEMIEYSLDITERKQLQKELEHANKELDHLLKQKDAFVNQLGHDLKNPLTPITRLLPKVLRDTKDPKTLERLDIISRNIDYIKNLIFQTLRLAQLNSSAVRFNFSEIPLHQLINDVLSENQYQIKEKNITVSNLVGKQLVVNADPVQLKEVVTNLISNAVKYMETGQKIQIKSSSVQDEMVTIMVKDKGIGMTSEEIDHMFDEFYKADPSRHDFHSTGLGLTIIKRIVEQHQGTIWAESEGKGKGTTIYFTLPVLKEVTVEENAMNV